MITELISNFIRTALVVVTILLPMGSSAQGVTSPLLMETANPFSVQQWKIEQGLPQNAANDIIQTSDGYLWIATFGGLARFDGVSFETFDLAKNPELASNRILSLYEDSHGKLWIGHERSGITTYKNGRFTNIGGQGGMANKQVTDFVEDDEGNMWIATTFGLYKSPIDSIEYQEIESFSNHHISDLLKDKEGAIWLTTGVHGYAGGLFKIYNQQVQKITESNWSFSSVALGNNGEIWAGGFDGFGKTEDFDNDLAYKFLTPSIPRINSIYLRKDQSIWLATSQGLLSYGVKNGHMTPIDMVTTSMINKIFEDREGNIWICTSSQGIYQLKLKPVVHYSQVDADKSFSVVCSNGKGGLWMGSSCDGLIQLQDGEFTKHSIPGMKCITALCLARDGTLWLAHNSYLGKIKNGIHTFVDQPELSQRIDIIQTIIEDNEGSIWYGTGNNGVYKLDDGNFTHYTTNNGLLDNHVRFLTQTKDSSIWIGMNSGIARFKEGRFDNYTQNDGLPSGAVRSIYEDIDNNIWIGTYGGGLGRIKEGKVTRYTKENGLFENVVSRITEDDKGNLWMVGNQGIFFVPRKMLNKFDDGNATSIHSVVLGPEEGMSEGNGSGSLYRTLDGKIWVPTVDGVGSINIDSFKLNEVPPSVIIENARISGKLIRTTEAIELQPGQSDVEIQYTGISFFAAEKVKFKYRLEGYDPDWIDVGTRRNAYYTNLSPRKYTFSVKASNNDGVWNNVGASISINVLPAFWQTWWAKTGYVVLGIIAVFGIMRLRTMGLERDKQVLETIVTERTSKVVEQKEEILSQNEELASTLEQLTSTQNLLVQSEKMASLGTLTAGIAHEINNPINFVKVGTEALKRDLLDLLKLIDLYRTNSASKDIQEHMDQMDIDFVLKSLPGVLDDIEAGTRRTANIVKGLQSFAQLDVSESSEADINECIDSALALFSDEESSNIELIRNYQSDIQSVTCYPGQLIPAFLNIINNAREALKTGGMITITTSQNKNHISISFKDNGAGISDEIIDKVFDPFFTTKVVGEGSGLGLAVVHGIIKNHGGSIEVNSPPTLPDRQAGGRTGEEGKGSEFVITLPR